MHFQSASNVTAPTVEWLWPGYLALGSLAVLDGDPGIGKSLFTLDLAARLTSGRSWPDEAPAPLPASVLLLCAEDGEGVVRERLTVAGADLSRVFVWPRRADEDLPRLPSQVAAIDDALAATGARLVVIDPIMAFLDRNVDVNTDANARRALAPLARMAEKRGCVIVMVRHLNKKEGATSLYRGGASIAFVAACRLAWLAAKDPKVEGRCILAQAKNNYSAPHASLAYTLAADAPRIQWEGQSVLVASELAGRRRASPILQQVSDFLRSFLAAGPRSSRDIWAAATERQFTQDALKRARLDLGIVCKRREEKGKRFADLSLPSDSAPMSEIDRLLAPIMGPAPATPLDEDLPAFDFDAAFGRR